MKEKKFKYKLPGIGGRNKPKGDKPLPRQLMAKPMFEPGYPKIKMEMINETS